MRVCTGVSARTVRRKRCALDGTVEGASVVVVWAVPLRRPHKRSSRLQNTTAGTPRVVWDTTKWLVWLTQSSARQSRGVLYMLQALEVSRHTLHQSSADIILEPTL